MKKDSSYLITSPASLVFGFTEALNRCLYVETNLHEGLQNGDGRNLPDIKPKISGDMENPKIWKWTEIREPSQLRSLRLPDGLLSVRVRISQVSSKVYIVSLFV